MRQALGFLAAAAALIFAMPAAAADVPALLKTLQAVGPRGAGHREASQAWAELAQADAAVLPAMLAALDGANPLAANWIRVAIDTIAERALDRGGRLPGSELEKFVITTGHCPSARRLAYEWLTRADPSAAERLMPGMLNDPSLEMRRDAVAALMEQAAELQSKGASERARELNRKALAAARDVDQVRLLAERLRKKGVPVDLARHFGFLTHWQVIGPFDNTGEKGFDVAYPPEKSSDLAAAWPGKHGSLKWIAQSTTDDYGQIDLNKAFAEEKGVAGYAFTEFVAQSRQEVEFRLTSFNATKLWLNGRLIDAHNVYHSGSQMDQYVSRAVLQPGRNTILVKVCQNELKQDWARVWGFQLRVCDACGTAILSAERGSAHP